MFQIIIMSLLFGTCLAFVHNPSLKSFGLRQMEKQVRLLSTASDLRTYAGYSVYKGKGAVNLKVIPVTFTETAKARTVEREGTLMFEFAPATGSRQYNWGQKIAFGVSPTECGEFLAMDKSKGLELTHDPYAGGPDAGKVVKKLKVAPTADNKGVFLSVTMNDKVVNTNAQVSIPLTWGEWEVIRTVASYHIPLLLGFGSYTPMVHSAESAGSGSYHSAAPSDIPPVWN